MLTNRSDVASENHTGNHWKLRNLWRAAKAMFSRHVGLAGIVIAHALLAGAYAFVVPLGEAPDEPGHFAYAEYIAAHGSIPDADLKLGEISEVHQPPLYYLLASLPIRLVSPKDSIEVEYLFARRAVKPALELEGFAWGSAALGWRLARLTSTLLSVLSITATYAACRLLLPDRPRLATFAAAIYGFWPGAVFMAGVLNNDSGIRLSGAMVLFGAAWIAQPYRWATRAMGNVWVPHLFLAVVAASATLVKDSGVAIVGFFLLVEAGVLTLALIRGRRTEFLTAVGSIVVCIALIFAGYAWSDGRSGRMFASIVAIGGDLSREFVGPAGAGTPSAAQPAAGQSVVLEAIRWWTSSNPLSVANQFLENAIALYGWASVRLPESWYAFSKLVVAAGILGFGLALRSRARVTGFAACLLLAHLIFMIVGPIYRAGVGKAMILTVGRFLLPALASFSIILAVGFAELGLRVTGAARRSRPFLSSAFAGWFIVVSTLALPVIIVPRYQGSPILVENGEAPQTPLSITYGDEVRLVGFSAGERTAPGGVLIVSAYWEAVRKPVRDLAFAIEVFDARTGASLRTKYESRPAKGAAPTRDWRVGERYVETYFIQTWDHTPAPVVVNFRIRVLDTETGADLSATCETNPCQMDFGRAAIEAERGYVQQWQATAPRFRWSNDFELVDVQLSPSMVAGDMMRFLLVWRSLADRQPNTTTFVHIRDEQGRLVSQNDMPPRNGSYPRSVWRAGEIVPDDYFVPSSTELPPGLYTVYVGAYEPATGERQVVLALGNGEVVDNIALIATIRITAR